MKVAYVTFTQDPLGLHDLQTWQLVLIGVLFAVGAAVTGYKTDDPIPGYGAVSRRYKAAELAYQDLKQQYLGGIEATAEAYLSAVGTHYAEVEAAMHEYREGVAKTERLASNYRLESAAITDACVVTLKRYRATNEQIRTDKAPAYFLVDPHPFERSDFLDLDLAGITEWEAVVRDLGQKLTLFTGKAEATKAQLRNLCGAYLNQTPAYFEEIEQVADGLPPESNLVGTKPKLLVDRNRE